MSQTQTIGKHKTAVLHRTNTRAGHMIEVWYHNTQVVRVTDKEITLNTGGWSTVTTKLRMNQAANEYGLGYKVFQKDYAWFVTYKGETIPFKEYSLKLKR